MAASVVGRLLAAVQALLWMHDGDLPAVVGDTQIALHRLIIGSLYLLQAQQRETVARQRPVYPGAIVRSISRPSRLLPATPSTSTPRPTWAAALTTICRRIDCRARSRRSGS